MKPKILIISLVVAFIVALCCIGTIAADEVITSSNGLFQYTVHDGNKATITKYLGEETTVNVNKIDGRYTVDSIGYAAFAENTKIQSVNIYATVTSIGESAFEACTALKSVTFRTGSALTEIGEYAFFDCDALSEFEFTEKLVSIGYGAFQNCSKLKFDLSAATSLEEIGEYAFSSCGNSASSFDVTIPSKVKTVGYGAFYGCSAVSGFSVAPGNGAFSVSDGVLMNSDGSEIIIYPMSKTATSFSVPSSVKKIGDGAFAGVTSLETLTVPDGVTEIGGGAFYNASSLKKITFPSSLKAIGSYAFLGCSSLEEIDLPSADVSLGVYLFRTCTSLKTVKLPEGMKEIPTGMFDSCPALVDIKIPSTVTKIGQYAFNFCRALKEIEIPASLRTIEDYAFRYCTSLVSFSAPNVTKIGKFALQDCSVLRSADISGVDEIPAYIFEGCAVLSDVKLPANYTKIGNYAFRGCEMIGSLVIPASCKSIGDFAFGKCAALTEMTIPASVEKTGIAMFEGSGVTKVVFECAITKIPLNTFGECMHLTSVEFPSTVKEIGASAFAGCVNLVSLPYDVYDHIGACAFYGCRRLEGFYVGTLDDSIQYGTYFGCNSLTDVVIPENITDIGSLAFSTSAQLKSVTMNGVRTIEAKAFAECPLLSEVKIESRLNFIGESAFSSCSKLTSLSLPKSVSFVGENAFQSTGWERNQKNEFVIVGDGVFYKYNGSASVIVFPEETKRISKNRLSGVEKIETVIIPENVKYIAKYAFSILAKSTSSSGQSSTYYSLRSIKVRGKHGTYAEVFANHVYYTFEAY